MADLETLDTDGLSFQEQGSDPSTPALTDWRVYFKSGGMYVIDDAGTVYGPLQSAADHNHTAAAGDGGDLDFPVIDGYAVFNEEAAAGTADAGTVRVYAKTDDKMYAKDDAGTEYGPFGSGIADQGTVTYLDYTEAAAPATPSAGKVRLYAKTDGSLYQKDDAGTETGLGGGGGGWTLTIDEDGTSFANFTGLSGTWASTGTIIQQTQTGAANKRAKYNTRVRTSAMVAQVDIRFPSASTGAAAGILCGFPGTDISQYPIAFLSVGLDKVTIGRESTTAPVDVAVTINLDTWYTLRVHVSGNGLEAFVDGTYYGAARIESTNGNADNDNSFVGLRTYDGAVDFRNFKVWTLDLPA